MDPQYVPCIFCGREVRVGVAFCDIVCASGYYDKLQHE